jgi:glycosyltransferase EpsH
MNIAFPSITFIIPVFNVEKYIKKCLSSIIAQKNPDWEVIIIDDGSTDASASICKSFIEKHSNIRIVSQKNQGQGIARNTGMRLAQGRFICFVDPDDWVHEDMTKDLISAMDSSDAAFANFGIEYITTNGTVSKRFVNFDYSELKGSAIFENAIMDSNVLSSPCNKVYKRSFLQENNILFPPTRAYEDSYFSRLVGYYARKCLFINKIYYHALVRPGSTTREMSIRRVQDAIYILQLERDKFIGSDASDHLRSLFSAHAIKFLSLILIHAAYRVPKSSDYMQCVSLLDKFGYRQLAQNRGALKNLKLKNQLAVQISLRPRVLRILVNLLTRCGIQPY